MSVANNIFTWTMTRRPPRTPREAVSNFSRNTIFIVQTALTGLSGVLGLFISGSCFQQPHSSNFTITTMGTLSSANRTLLEEGSADLSCLTLNAVFLTTNISLLVGSLLTPQRTLIPLNRSHQILRMVIIGLQTTSTFLAMQGNILGLIHSIHPQEETTSLISAQLSGIAGGLQCVTVVCLMASSAPITLTTREELVELMPNEEDNGSTNSLELEEETFL